VLSSTTEEDRFGVIRRQHQVLVVDDDASVRALYADALEEFGHTVAMASDGTAALEQLRTGDHPCVVLTDLRMPQMDGFELRRAVERDPHLASIPIVVITGDKMLSLTSPAGDKPFSSHEVDALVQRSCSLHRVPARTHGVPADDRATQAGG
jgi:CheY-like chemotaxis protein